MIEKTEDEKKEMMKNAFLSTHLLRQGNKQAVVSWFESYYQNHLQKKDWWKLQNLLSIPPLARDWAVGYTPLLDEFTEDLTRAEYQNHIKNVVGRKKEIEQIENILIMNEEANVLIVGEEGVGKHAIVDALSKRIYEGQTNSILAYKRILKLNLEKILTTYVDQKQRESFLEDLFMEAAEARNVILLIENLDKYVAYDQGRIDLSIPMEKFGKTACIQFIGLTTPFFYQKFIFANDKINRIFSKLDVAEIPAAEAINTLLEVAHLYEQKNNVVIPYETILDVVDRSEFYITYIPFPEKAFNLLDMGCAYGNQKRFNIITPDIIDTVLSEKTHIPTRLSDSMRTKLIKLEKLLEERIVSQHEAIEKLAAAMRRSFIILGKRKKPLASFLFFGPTGVGKTETAKALSDIFFGSEKYLLRFDMSLYQTTGDIKTLIGSIESGMPGHLSKAIRENPYAVLLLDEIEKADKDLLNIFLTLIDEGYFTDGFGKKVDCKNLIVIATSNASPDFFLPEFLNRFDGVVTYNPVTEESVLMLAKKMTDSTKETIYKLYKIHVEITDSTLKNLIKKGYDQKYGARNLQRIIARELEDKIAKRILEKKVQEGDTISL
jgi:ATP-dependent Clp protease ATP-binding subunit ClpA